MRSDRVGVRGEEGEIRAGLVNEVHRLCSYVKEVINTGGCKSSQFIVARGGGRKIERLRPPTGGSGEVLPG